MSDFVFHFDPRYRFLLAGLGVRESNALVRVDEHGLAARFGPWRCATTLDNVVGAEVTGPYSPIKAIGPRLSMKDRGLTFGTNAERGVCIRFREPVAGLEPTGLLRHPG